MKLFWAFILALTAFTGGLFYARHTGDAPAPVRQPPTVRGSASAGDPAPRGFVPLRRPQRESDDAAAHQGLPPAAHDGQRSPSAPIGAEVGASADGSMAREPEAFERDDPGHASAHHIPDPIPIEPRPKPTGFVSEGPATTPPSAPGWSDDAQAVSDLLNSLLGVDPSTVPDTIVIATPAGGSQDATEADAPSADPNRFTFEGAGTPDDPFIVPWEALVSARDTYRPRKGKRDIPPWVQKLHGKTVLLNGYLLLPIMQTTTDEVLLMRNQWDGCCIGVPPTPYDAIEIKLAKSTKELSRTRMNYGAIQGTLKVDPYLVKDWLVGLYLMEDGILRDMGF